MTFPNGYVRDKTSKAILNNNLEGYERILSDRKRSQELTDIKTTINCMKNEINNLKVLVHEIIELNGFKK